MKQKNLLIVLGIASSLILVAGLFLPPPLPSGTPHGFIPKIASGQ
jgi:hypothetical protein